MDELDLRILAELVRDPTASVAGVARAVSLTANGVRGRLRALEQARVYRGVAAIPNPALFGLRGVVLVFPKGSSAGLDAREILAIDGVAGYSVNHSDVLAVIAWTADPSDPVPPGLEAVAGGRPERTFVQRPRPLTPPGAALSPREWRVLEAIVRHPRGTVASVARASGVPTKAARRAVARMRRGSHVYYEPLVFSDFSRGTLVYEMYVQGPAAKDPARILRTLGNA